MSIRSFARWSPINIVTSNWLFNCVKWRLFCLRLKNKLKKTIKNKNYPLLNDAVAGNSLALFMSQGYTKVNIGGGGKNLIGFVNIDFTPHRGVEREVIANILDLNFIPDSSLSHVHSNHVVEHLSPIEFQDQLAQYYRAMKKQGLLTIRCPNTLGVCYGFLFEVVPEINKDEFLNLGFPADEDFYNPLDKWYHKNFYGFLHWVYGDAGNIENQHLNIFTPSKIQKAITLAGFNVVKMSEPESSNIIVIARKE
ncbi:MAG: hypothetical protein A2103_04260 [Gammaproteobacteria bacterium GWF2_41_13]|nr:MAG: hypothetical protein A2103_04260 [Gammaproteobacteria bacterium GWF2_41_13]